ncbi:MAG TPA: enoyl-CoA hydratase-related protein, partial [Anaerovoracaceae bacterium]|nr:enoyl-CoA hydratase-related protein [Anaerovoracaceae bacterium]
KVNRPKVYNSLTKETVQEIDALIEDIKKNKNIKVLIIGCEKNFAAGADIKTMVNCDEEQAREFIFTNTYNKIENLYIPTIAAIDGFALGGGLELALTCDFRIITPKAKVGLPEINLGIIPGAGGTIRLRHLIGLSKAREMVLFGETISGEEAFRIGLANKLVEPEELMDTAMDMARKLQIKSVVALKSAKKAIRAGLDGPDLETALRKEAEIWTGLFKYDDAREGLKAFLEKRLPKYTEK